jgi:hypothetical protein
MLTWFDRINRYRVAAGVLFIPFLLTLFAWIIHMPVDSVMPMIPRRGIYWAGLVFLTLAIAMDAWEVYAGKRRVKRLIQERIDSDLL